VEYLDLTGSGGVTVSATEPDSHTSTRSDDGSFAVIGVDVTAELGETPLFDARCAPNERIVRIPRSTLVAARKDIPEE